MMPTSDSHPLQSVRGVMPRLAARALAALACLAAVFGPAFAASGAWQDPATGLAIGGYDPLAYFTRGKARTGRDGIELSWSGAVWRFLNTGNRAAFKRDPDVYAPRFAGYDAYALSRGVVTRGHPLIWARRADRIYLFHNAANLRLWQQNRDAITKLAEKNWPALSDSLPSSLAE